MKKNNLPFFTRSCRRHRRSVLAAPPCAAALCAPLSSPPCAAEQEPLSVKQANKLISCEKNNSPFFTRSCRRHRRSILAAPPCAAASPTPLPPPPCGAEQQPLSVQQANKIISYEQKITHFFHALLPPPPLIRPCGPSSCRRIACTAATPSSRRGATAIVSVAGQ